MHTARHRIWKMGSTIFHDFRVFTRKFCVAVVESVVGLALTSQMPYTVVTAGRIKWNRYGRFVSHAVEPTFREHGIKILSGSVNESALLWLSSCVLESSASVLRHWDAILHPFFSLLLLKNFLHRLDQAQIVVTRSTNLVCSRSWEGQ